MSMVPRYERSSMLRSAHISYLAFLDFPYFVFSRARKMRKAAVSFVMSVCLSIWPHETTRLPLDGFLWDLIFEYFFFPKSVEKLQVSLNSEKNNGCFTWRPIYIQVVSRRMILGMRNVSGKSCRENQNMNYCTHNICMQNVVICRRILHTFQHFRIGMPRK